MGKLVLLLIIFLVMTSASISISNHKVRAEEIDLPYLYDNNIDIQIVYTGIKFPTKMAFLGPNDILVLEKNVGTVKRIVNGVMLSDPLLKLNVSNISERGMLGVAVEDNSTDSRSRSVFLYFTKPEKENTMDDMRNLASNTLYRFDLLNNKLVNPELLLDLPSSGNSIHNGGALLIGPDDNIYLIVGNGEGAFDEYNTKSESQNQKEGINPDGRGGILVITQDGKPVHKNGLLGRDFPLNLYYGYGIRNSFGIDFDPVSGKIWDTENGGQDHDEINLVEPGFNSGHKQVQGLSTMQEDFSKSNLETFDNKGHYSEPEFTFKSSVGLTGIKFLNSDKLGTHYQNDLFVGDFHNGNLYHFELDKTRTGISLTGALQDRIANENAELESILFGQGFGGITDIKVGPDGYLYILSLYQGGDNCQSTDENSSDSSDCVKYESDILGTIFRIVPKLSQN